MRIRKSSMFFVSLVLQCLLLALMAIHAVTVRAAAAPGLAEKQALVRLCGLSDLCLFTEARYTRHPALADLHSAFQDGPFSFEHFPSGSLVDPPAHLRGVGDD